MSSSVHIDNKGKDIFIHGEEPTQGLNDTTLTSEAIYPVNFKQGNGREKDGNRDKSIGVNLVIFFYKEFKKFAL